MRAYHADAGFDGERAMRDEVVVVVDGDRIVGIETSPGDLPAGLPVTRWPGRRCCRA